MRKVAALQIAMQIENEIAQQEMEKQALNPMISHGLIGAGGGAALGAGAGALASPEDRLRGALIGGGIGAGVGGGAGVGLAALKGRGRRLAAAEAAQEMAGAADDAARLRRYKDVQDFQDLRARAGNGSLADVIESPGAVGLQGMPAARSAPMPSAGGMIDEGDLAGRMGGVGAMGMGVPSMERLASAQNPTLNATLQLRKIAEAVYYDN